VRTVTVIAPRSRLPFLFLPANGVINEKLGWSYQCESPADLPDINHRANDRQKLQTLAIELQELLREDCYGREDWHNAAALRRNMQSDDPFDKLIMVA